MDPPRQGSRLLDICSHAGSRLLDICSPALIPLLTDLHREARPVSSGMADVPVEINPPSQYMRWLGPRGSASRKCVVRVTYIMFGTRSASIVGVAQYSSGLVLD